MVVALAWRYLLFVTRALKMVNHSVWCQSRMLSIRIDELKRLPMHTQTLSFSCVWYDLYWRSFEEQRLQIWNLSWHSLPCSNYTLTHSVPRCAVSCQQNAIQAARFIPTRVGTTRLHKPNVSQSALTHSSDRCQIKYNTHTQIRALPPEIFDFVW